MPDLDLQSKPQHICVMRLSAIGDTCHALAVIRRIQDNWPSAQITWIIGRAEATLMAGIPDIDFVIFDKSRGRKAYRDVKAALKGKQFDVALCMHASLRANLLIPKLPSANRLGFDKARAKDFQWLFTNCRIAPSHNEHAMDAMMGFATAIGAEERPLRWDIPIDTKDRKFAHQYADDGRPLVVISPCSSQRARNFRNWDASNYAAAIEHLESEYDARIVLTGGNSSLEKEYGEALTADSDAENLIGQTSLKQLAALIAAARLVICPDSGPAHMATALGTSVLGLYATSNPERTGPYLSLTSTINRYPDAITQYIGANVADAAWGKRVRDPGAMGLITVSEVLRGIDSFFEEEDN